MAKEETSVATEGILLLQLLMQICKYYNIEPKSEQHMVNALDPFQISEGEELIREFNVLEVDIKCHYDSLVDDLGKLVQKNNDGFEEFAFGLATGLHRCWWSMIALSTEGYSKKENYFWGVRRHKNRPYWVYRQPTPAEKLQQAAAELGGMIKI